MNWELTLTIAINLIVLAYFVGTRNQFITDTRKSIEEMKSYFNEKIDDLKDNFKEHLDRVEAKQEKHNNLVERMVRVEQSSSSAHKRIDKWEEKE